MAIRLHIFQNKRNLIDDSRNELEKAYGPLYTSLNNFQLGIEKNEETFFINSGNKMLVYEKMANFLFMFPTELYTLWKNKVQNSEAVLNLQTLQPISYEIPTEFREKINKELVSITN